MGRRGPPAQPRQLKLLKGETRPSRLGAPEPEPSREAPEAPVWLAPAASEAWRLACRELEAMELLSSADREVLVLFACAVADYAKGQQLLDSSGLVLKGRDGNAVRNPLVAITRDRALLVARLARELGLTPTGRAQLGALGTAVPDESAANRLLS